MWTDSIYSLNQDRHISCWIIDVIKQPFSNCTLLIPLLVRFSYQFIGALFIKTICFYLVQYTCIDDTDNYCTHVVVMFLCLLCEVSQKGRFSHSLFICDQNDPILTIKQSFWLQNKVLMCISKVISVSLPRMPFILVTQILHFMRFITQFCCFLLIILHQWQVRIVLLIVTDVAFFLLICTNALQLLQGALSEMYQYFTFILRTKFEVLFTQWFCWCNTSVSLVLEHLLHVFHLLTRGTLNPNLMH